jgi:hypothetical protein
MEKSNFIKHIEKITIPSKAKKLLQEMQESPEQVTREELNAIQEKIKEIGTQDKRYLVFYLYFYNSSDVFPIVAHFDTIEEVVEFVPSKDLWDDFGYEVYDRVEGCIVNLK